jgi:hypothetical protein
MMPHRVDPHADPLPAAPLPTVLPRCDPRVKDAGRDPRRVDFPAAAAPADLHHPIGLHSPGVDIEEPAPGEVAGGVSNPADHGRTTQRAPAGGSRRRVTTISGIGTTTRSAIVMASSRSNGAALSARQRRA